MMVSLHGKPLFGLTHTLLVKNATDAYAIQGKLEDKFQNKLLYQQNPAHRGTVSVSQLQGLKGIENGQYEVTVKTPSSRPGFIRDNGHIVWGSREADVDVFEALQPKTVQSKILKHQISGEGELTLPIKFSVPADQVKDVITSKSFGGTLDLTANPGWLASR